MDENRRRFIDYIEKEMIGPANGPEEEIPNDAPLSLYFSGVLFPQLPDSEKMPGEEILDVGLGPVGQEQNRNGAKGDQQSVSFSLAEDETDYLSLSMAFKQSALSLTVAIRKNDYVAFSAFAGKYNYVSKGGKVFYKRTPIGGDSSFSFDELVSKSKESSPLFVVDADSEGKTTLDVRSFLRGEYDDYFIFTFSLVNEKTNSDKMQNAFTYFQCKLKLKSQIGFLPLPTTTRLYEPDEDALNNELLYRKVAKYAAGHGCSPVWDDQDSDECVFEIESSFLPRYELRAISHTSFEDVDLDMEKISNDLTGNFAIKQARSIANAYRSWIANLEEQIKTENIQGSLKVAAGKNIEKCKVCLQRMENGISLLEDDKTVLMAFLLANKCMCIQQRRSRLERRTFEKSNNPPFYTLAKEIDHQTLASKCAWRPFQFTFLLITMVSIARPETPERSMVDLIWFPTGGGKTEAYLGLTAFTILWKRLSGGDTGKSVQVFMRYTLRLLTSQQFDRASSLICALENEREKDPEHLGTKPITIGLWVGSDTSPNTHSDALKKLSEKDVRKNPFVMTKCPWCGAEMGPSKIIKDYVGVYVKNKKVHLACADKNCDFSSQKRRLPLLVIDEDIYENPPTVMIATVDKFARIPFQPKIKNLFGLAEGPTNGREHPELIVQDELHLISGPLGSMVGSYETIFDVLCSYEMGGVTRKPKIVASTATIAMAKEQCRGVFAVKEDDVKVFPCSGIDAGESFFSTINRNQKGRAYVGYCGPAAPSVATASIHLLATLTNARSSVLIDSKYQKDAYWTNLCYFNSIRELGTAATWINADIKEYLNNHFHKKQFLSSLELTSRIDSGNIKDQFEKLSVSSIDNPKKALDICVATNMISVGVDVPRLGLMTVFGQPKTTAEYIQASSRVGRATEVRPGIVVTVYNPAKPRDKSVFESFQNFHSQFYAYVEPTSVSPFAPQLRSISLPGIIVGICRSLFVPSPGNEESLSHIINEWGDVATDLILKRVSLVDPEEHDDTKKQISKILKSWNDAQIQTISIAPNFDGTKPTKISSAPAIYPSDWTLDEKFRSSYPVMSTMRSVDKTCRLKHKQ